MPGSNLDYSGSKALRREILRVLDRRRGRTGSVQMCMKNGAPTNNDEDDEPQALYDLLWDYNNDRVYICTAYTDATTHTWQRLDG